MASCTGDFGCRSRSCETVSEAVQVEVYGCTAERDERPYRSQLRLPHKCICGGPPRVARGACQDGQLASGPVAGVVPFVSEQHALTPCTERHKGAQVDDPAKEFMGLFIGNDRSFGRFFPTTGKMSTTKAPYSHEHFAQHLQGLVGVGIVPILDSAHVRFAAIDIDAHGDIDHAIDVAALSVRVETLDLPLLVCHSKNRGAHCYIFFREPVPAQMARMALQRWAIDLGHPGVEIFPKQAELPADRSTGERPFGGWINLPYFGGDTRMCVMGGEVAELGHFIETAQAKALTLEAFRKFAINEHSEAPPCIQRMLAEGVRAGANIRNVALFNASLYMKRAFPDNYRNRALDFNATILAVPYLAAEAISTINSATKSTSSKEGSYRYKCKEEPSASLCDRQVCLTRKFGITPFTDDEDGLSEVQFSDLMKYESNPVRWQISADGKPMIIATNELHSFQTMRTKVFERLHFWIKGTTQAKWEKQLNAMSAPDKLVVVETPMDVSKQGLVQTRLMQYLGKAVDDGTDQRARLKLSKPAPCFINYEGGKLPAGRYVVFDFNDFKDYLRRTKSDEFKEGIDLHTIMLSHCGVKSVRLRVGDVLVSVRALPAALMRAPDVDAEIPESEL